LLRCAVAALPLACVAVMTGCGGFDFIIGGRPEAVIQNDLRLPRGTRVAVIPLTLYGYEKEKRPSVSNAAYATQLAAMLKAGFHVVERTLVEKAVDEYAKSKRFDKVAGAQGAVYQEEGEEQEKIIDLVEIGRTLNVRLITAGSMQFKPGFLSSAVEARLRVTDVTTGEMVSNCESAGSIGVLDDCATSMAQQLSVRMSGPPVLGIR
jgi:hypothetical protein